MTEKRRTWFMVAADTAETFRWENILDHQGSTFWWLRKLPKNFRMAQEGDLILCYRSGSEKRGLVGLAVVEEEFNEDGIKVRGLMSFQRLIPYYLLKNEEVYRTTEAGRLRNRGTLFAVHDEFVSWVQQQLIEDGDERAAACLASRDFLFTLEK